MPPRQTNARFAPFFSLLVILAIGLVGPLKSLWPSSFPQSDQTEAIVFIVNKDNPLDNISFQDLRGLLLEERTTWPSNKRVTLVMQEAGTPARDLVLRILYRMNEKEYAQFLIHAEFTGSSRSDPKLLSDAKGVIKFVSLVPGAIGYVGADDADGTVKVIKIDGLGSNQSGYKLAYPQLRKSIRASARK